MTLLDDRECGTMSETGSDKSGLCPARVTPSIAAAPGLRELSGSVRPWCSLGVFMEQIGDRALSDFIPTKEAAERTRLTQRHVTHLVRMGTVEGVKPGHDWLVYWPSLDAYLATNPRPGPKSRTKQAPQGA